MDRRTRTAGIGVTAIAIVAALVVAFAARSATTEKLSVTLDWTPNPDHVGLYYAKSQGLFAAAGLSVDIHAPSDPAAPLKLVAIGRTDLAVSYEQEVFYAVAKRLPVVAVAAVVPRPLNSLMWTDRSITSISGLKGRKIGVTGVPSDYAMLDTVLARAHLTRRDVQVVSVGYNLLPALLAHRVDAIIGAYRNVEGVELQRRKLSPTIIPVDQAGVPRYDELVLVANAKRLADDPRYARSVRLLVDAFLRGTTGARAHAARALNVLAAVTASDRGFLEVATPLTLRLLTGPHGVGCLHAREWQRFGSWMASKRLILSSPGSRAAMTTRFLPARCSS